MRTGRFRFGLLCALLSIVGCAGCGARIKTASGDYADFRSVRAATSVSQHDIKTVDKENRLTSGTVSFKLPVQFKFQGGDARQAFEVQDQCVVSLLFSTTPEWRTFIFEGEKPGMGLVNLGKRTGFELYVKSFTKSLPRPVGYSRVVYRGKSKNIIADIALRYRAGDPASLHLGMEAVATVMESVKVK